MQLRFFKSKWERPDWSLPQFLKASRDAGFDGVELALFLHEEDPVEIGKRVADEGMSVIAQVVTAGNSQQVRMEALEKQFDMAEKARALHVSGHIGLDFAAPAENLALVSTGRTRALAGGLGFSVETHRGRMCFSTVDARQYLELDPELRLTADFSHWTCVSESDLSNQSAFMDRVIDTVDHIHARVGFDQGPQVPDPFAAEYKPWLDRFTSWWQRIIDTRTARGCGLTSITPEFGPVPYAWKRPGDESPFLDPWELNTRMLSYLKNRLNAEN